MKKILLNILTHGDESVGKKIADEIQRKYPNIIGNGLDIQIANPMAYEKGVRYIDKDLNRVFPGKEDGVYEERRAVEISKIISGYELVIDIHSTESGSQDIVIVTTLDESTQGILKVLSPRYVLYMNMQPQTSLISIAKIGIAFEMGSNISVETYEKTIQGIEIILNHYSLIPTSQSFGYQTQYFEVFTSIPKPLGGVLLQHVENFKEIKKGEVFAQQILNKEEIRAEFDFYPVIFGSTNYEKIFGFAARKTN